jgi:hypothetical protein
VRLADQLRVCQRALGAAVLTQTAQRDTQARQRFDPQGHRGRLVVCHGIEGIGGPAQAVQRELQRAVIE